MEHKTTTFADIPKKNKINKKMIIRVGIGGAALALIIGVFFVGFVTADNKVSGNCRDDKSKLSYELETVEGRLAFTQADLENTQKKLEGAEKALAEATGQPQPATPVSDIREQLQRTLDESNSQWKIGQVGDVKDSPVKPFQTVIATSTDSFWGQRDLLFWRNGTSGEWRFFWGAPTQVVLACWRFVDFIEPFSGFPCLYNTGNDHYAETTVGEHYSVMSPSSHYFL
jgi:hypothetical protein